MREAKLLVGESVEVGKSNSQLIGLRQYFAFGRGEVVVVWLPIAHEAYLDAILAIVGNKKADSLA